MTSASKYPDLTVNVDGIYVAQCYISEKHFEILLCHEECPIIGILVIAKLRPQLTGPLIGSKRPIPLPIHLPLRIPQLNQVNTLPITLHILDHPNNIIRPPTRQPQHRLFLHRHLTQSLPTRTTDNTFLTQRMLHYVNNCWFGHGNRLCWGARENIQAFLGESDMDEFVGAVDLCHGFLD